MKLDQTKTDDILKK